ncbi:MAG TPA: hypothetical protein VGQ96_04395 [Candidatus Eremiobacteraceae bacterium]|nr:hypothetical protein [Candidatus Eremiobacteraceae bacterium]
MKRLTLIATVFAFAAAIVLGVAMPTLAADQPLAATTTNASVAAAGGGAERISLAKSKNPFELLSPDSPEIAALKVLAKDGFITQNAQPLADGKPIMRYQAAMMAAEAITTAETMVHQGKVVAINKMDVAALQQTFESFKADLSTLKGRVDTLDTRVAAVEQSQASMHEEMTKLDQTVAAVVPEKTKAGFELHGEFRVRPVNSFSQSSAGTDVTGAPLAKSTFVSTSGFNGATVPIGNNGFGQMEARLRLIGTGTISDTAKFIIRLSTEENAGANNGLGSWVHNDFDFFEYNLPQSSWNFYGGKLLYCCNTPWLPDGSGLIADAVPIGVAAKWTSMNKRWSAWGSAGSVKNAETTPTQLQPNGPGLTQNVTAFHLESHVGSVLLAYQYLGLNSQAVTNFIVPAGSPPTSGSTVTAFGPVTVGSLFINGNITPQFNAQAEFLLRYGNDPTTRKGYADPSAWLVDLAYGSSALWHSQGTARYVRTGKNSVLNGFSIINSVDSMWNAQFLPNATNVQLYELGYFYQFDKNGNLGLQYGHSSLATSQPGTNGSTLTSDGRNLFTVTTRFGF